MYPEHLSILLIEDNPADSVFFKTILSDEKNIDIKIFSEKTLTGGISFCNDFSNKVDVVLLDLTLPDSEGISTIETFSNLVPEKPVVVFAGPNDRVLAMTALKLGAQDYVIKGEYDRILIIKSIFYAIEKQKLKLNYYLQKHDFSEIEKGLHTIITNVLDSVLVVDKNGLIKFSNPAAQKMLDKTQEQLYNFPFGIPVQDGLKAVDIEVFNPQGNEIVAELHVKNINWEANEAYLCTIRDITQSKNSEEAIKENEEKFKAIARSASDVIMHLDENLQIDFINPATEKIFGLKPDDITGKSFTEVFKNNKQFVDLIKQKNNTEFSGKNFELTGFRKNHESFPMEISLSLFKRKGKPQTVCIIRDITERKKVQEELLHTKKELEKTLLQLKNNQQKLVEIEKLNSVKELAGAISHEFAQPLQALYNYLHLIQNREVKEEYFQKAREMLNRIADLTTSLKNITALHKKEYLKSKIIDLFASSTPSQQKINKNILVVDDEREILESMMDILKNAGYNCTGASNGKEALEMVNNDRYDLIISDIMMPKMSGPELLKEVRKLNLDTHFIFLTGYDIPEEAFALKEKVDFTIQKPISFAELLGYVDKVLQN